MNEPTWVQCTSPIGNLTIQARDETVIAVRWGRCPPALVSPVLREAMAQLQAYFAGRLREFDLPLAPAGGEFQQRVFAQMRAIPYGQTRTYGELAKALDTFGQPVGQACGANPIPIIIPCHRVLGAKDLGGYSGEGGIETKTVLLKLEDAFPYLL